MNTLIMIALVSLIAVVAWDLIQRTKAKSDEKMLATFNILIENQTKTTQSVIAAVDTISNASSKQAEVLSKYLDLFKSPGDPQRWGEEDPEQTNIDELVKMGFPKEGDDATQAKWVLDHIGEI